MAEGVQEAVTTEVEFGGYPKTTDLRQKWYWRSDHVRFRHTNYTLADYVEVTSGDQVKLTILSFPEPYPRNILKIP
jgi:hypothetical protein